jgi:hypothetical protein
MNDQIKEVIVESKSGQVLIDNPPMFAPKGDSGCRSFQLIEWRLKVGGEAVNLVQMNVQRLEVGYNLLHSRGDPNTF